MFYIVILNIIPKDVLIQFLIFRIFSFDYTLGLSYNELDIIEVLKPQLQQLSEIRKIQNKRFFK